MIRNFFVFVFLLCLIRTQCVFGQTFYLDSFRMVQKRSGEFHKKLTEILDAGIEIQNTNTKCLLDPFLNAKTIAVTNQKLEFNYDGWHMESKRLENFQSCASLDAYVFSIPLSALYYAGSSSMSPAFSGLGENLK